MQIIGIASQKGGSGKTTLAGHLAVQAEQAGASPVALIDTDPQGSLSAWWNAREAETPCFARTTAATLKQDIDQLRELGMKLLIIDTPPAIEATIGDVIELCDLVVIPVRPSPHDLRAAGATVELVERAVPRRSPRSGNMSVSASTAIRGRRSQMRSRSKMSPRRWLCERRAGSIAQCRAARHQGQRSAEPRLGSADERTPRLRDAHDCRARHTR
jgi:cellulose biosynthesis protein BcsQ